MNDFGLCEDLRAETDTRTVQSVRFDLKVDEAIFHDKVHHAAGMQEPFVFADEQDASLAQTSNRFLGMSAL